MQLLAGWIDEYPLNETKTIIKELALHHARKGGTVGTRIAACITSDDYRSLCNFDIDYTDGSLSDLIHCRQALAFFQKLEPLDIGLDKESEAWSKFELAETHCRETNESIRLWNRGDFCFSPIVESVFFRAQRKISKILGPVPQLSELKFRFGPGATTRTIKRKANAREKLQAGASCSENFLPYASCVLAEMPHLLSLWATREDEETASVPVLVEPGRLGFVPKNAKTFRATVTEPVLNGLVQLGVGDYLTKRLAAFGLNLKDQTINQRLALKGSLTGELATLDLSSASDTISTELVYHLLPLDWACFLDRLRSRTVEYKGKLIKLEKFSSMGNGFTFPLESMIFYALVSSCFPSDATVSCFGDDIICPVAGVETVFQVLASAGFWVNSDKSFWDGPFRESCGGDYFRGFDIRPFYQKLLVSPRTLFALHNFYVRHLDFEMADEVLKYIHPSLQIFGPDRYGDGHLLGDWKPRRHKRELGWAGSLFDTFSLKPRRDTRPNQPGDRVLPLYQTYVWDTVPFDFGLMDPRDIPYVRYMNGIEEYPPATVFRDGTPVLGLPGSNGYKRISIYTLA